MVLRFLTAGESHGPALVVIIDGVPANLPLTKGAVDKELARRQLGVGRSERMKRADVAEILSGVRFGKTMGSPISLSVQNKAGERWAEVVTTPRPGHADLAGALKYEQRDIRNVLERASARETASRVATGAVAKAVLSELGIAIISHVVSIGGIWAGESPSGPKDLERIDGSPVRCLDQKASEGIVKAIEKAGQEGDSLGGRFEVIAYGVPPGLGSYAQWDSRLDGRLARAVMSIPAIKAVEVGEGTHLADVRGSQAHDGIFFEAGRGYYRQSNRAGGLEGGVTNGEPLTLRAAMKPIPTLGKPLQTVDILTKKPTKALKERADVCAVPSAAVVGEAMVAIELAGAVLDKFGGDSLGDLKRSYQAYLARIG